MNVLGTFVLVVFLGVALSPKSVVASEHSTTDQDIVEGMKLTEKEAQLLEETLKHHPTDLSIRNKLLAYYSGVHFEWLRGIRDREVLWIIEHHPEAPIAGLPYAQLDANFDPAAYQDGATLWKRQITGHANEPLVLRNAANYFLLHDRSLAEELLKRCAALEPQNPEWPEALGHLYFLGASGKTPAEKKLAATAALSQYERAFALTPEAYKSYLLDDLTKSAFDADDATKARMYAEQVLQDAGSSKKDWNLGNNIFFGNLILGRLALKAGDIEQAKHFLIEAGKTPGSPQLNSFGPNMTLAKELLEKGEKQVVLDYFGLCRKFWKYQPRLDSWTVTVKAGRIPDFGANLDY